MARKISVEFLGTEISYADGMVIMRREAEEIRNNPEAPEKLLLLEHRSTITTTRGSKAGSLLTSAAEIIQQGIELVETDRGGDVTFHGPGQLVGYPLMRLNKLDDPLSNHAYDLGGYIRGLELALVHACVELGLENAQILPGFTGVWVPNKANSFSKLVAIGVGVKGGISQHGFAFNVSNDYARFLKFIVPCGLAGKGVTQATYELLRLGFTAPSMATIRKIVGNTFCRQFSLSLVEPIY